LERAIKGLLTVYKNKEKYRLKLLDTRQELEFQAWDNITVLQDIFSRE
jgi:hypothetical protein